MPLLDHTNVLLATAAATLLTVVSLWLVSVARRDASIVDPFWGPGFVLIAGVAWWIGEGFQSRLFLIFALVAIWGLRLGTHLLARNAGHGEDRRYGAMREHHGASFWWVSLFTVFLLQGTLMWIISLPLQAVAVASEPRTWTPLDALGIVLWGIGMLFEAGGDMQLRRFLADPGNAGKVLDRGLWKYTRHPNYFGDAMVWWGLFAVAASTPRGLLLAFSPLLMTFFLLKVSGVVMLESDIAERRPAYRDYIERTSSFFPWPPRARRSTTESGPRP